MNHSFLDDLHDLNDFRRRPQARRRLQMQSGPERDREILAFLRSGKASENAVFVAVDLLQQASAPSLAELKVELLHRYPGLAAAWTVPLAAVLDPGSANAFLEALIGLFKPSELVARETHADHACLRLRLDGGRTHEVLLKFLPNHWDLFVECGAVPLAQAQDLSHLQATLPQAQVFSRPLDSERVMIVASSTISLAGGVIHAQQIIRRMAEFGDGIEQQLSREDVL